MKRREFLAGILAALGVPPSLALAAPKPDIDGIRRAADAFFKFLESAPEGPMVILANGNTYIVSGKPRLTRQEWNRLRDEKQLEHVRKLRPKMVDDHYFASAEFVEDFAEIDRILDALWEEAHSA